MDSLQTLSLCTTALARGLGFLLFSILEHCFRDRMGETGKQGDLKEAQNTLQISERKNKTAAK